MIQVDQKPGIDCSYSDEELVRQAQAGSLEAFTSLYERYLPMVYRWVRYAVREQEIEDVIQEIFISLLKSLRGFRGDAQFRTWLRTLTKRRIADYYRSRGQAEMDMDWNDAESLPIHQPHDHSAAVVADDHLTLRQALRELPEQYRDILLLRFGEGLQFGEIARVNGQSLEATKSLFRRALVAMRKQMGEEAYV